MLLWIMPVTPLFLFASYSFSSPPFSLPLFFIYLSFPSPLFPTPLLSPSPPFPPFRLFSLFLLLPLSSPSPLSLPPSTMPTTHAYSSRCEGFIKARSRMLQMLSPLPSAYAFARSLLLSLSSLLLSLY